MKDFLKMLAASILGCALTLFAGMLFILGIASVIISAGDTQAKAIPNNAILQIAFEKPLMEQSSENPFSKAVPFGLYQDDGFGYYELVSAIDRAKEDNRIAMIYLNTNFLNADISHVWELREALKRFRSNGKAVIAYSDSYTQAGYYLASAADKVYLNPQGEVGLRGFSISLRYYKGLMDELGVEAQLIRHGKYKSGGEPFIQQLMSSEERAQLDLFLRSAWDRWADEMAESRQISIETVNRVAEDAGCEDAYKAVDLQLVDEVYYKNELIDQLCKLQGVKSERALRIVNMQTYMTHKPLTKSREKVAILFADGTLYMGTGQQDIMSDDYIRTIRKLRADSSIKAVVLRVNSPGGDAQAAAVIHHELQLLKEAKPLIVSMGDNAASGGYWISSVADCIVGAPASVTGSIGAYAIAWNGQKGLNKWLKVNVETVKTHSSSNMGSIYRPLNTTEWNRIQKFIDQTYNNFVTTVSQDRGLSFEEVDALAQGRIWSGEDAQKNGLTDKIGGLYDAILMAAQLANLTDYQLVEYPAVGTFWERVKHSVSTESRLNSLGADPQKWAEEFENVIRQTVRQEIQAKIPFIYTLSY